MATFLSICQDVARESGTVSGSLDTVVGATNRWGKIVAWVRDAWEDIQTSRTDWRFMRTELCGQLVVGKNWYTGAEIGALDLAKWAVDQLAYEPFTLRDPAIGLADESAIRRIDWERWRDTYGRGAQQQQRPVEYAIGPGEEFCIGATPDKAYLVRGEYYRLPQLLAADADVPADLPPQHHKIIRFAALMRMAAHDEAPILLASARQDFAVAMHALVRQQTGRISNNAGCAA